MLLLNEILLDSSYRIEFIFYILVCVFRIRLSLIDVITTTVDGRNCLFTLALCRDILYFFFFVSFLFLIVLQLLFDFHKILNIVFKMCFIVWELLNVFGYLVDIIINNDLIWFLVLFNQYFLCLDLTGLYIYGVVWLDYLLKLELWPDQKELLNDVFQLVLTKIMLRV